MNCPECCTHMTVVESDSRQEWCRTIYGCSECHREFSRLTTYKQQSQLVESDEWESEE